MTENLITTFLLSTFLLTLIFNFSITLIKGRMLFWYWGLTHHTIKNKSARIFSFFILIFLLACSYFWLPINSLILNNILYTNLVSGLIGLILGTLIYKRGTKISSKKFNKEDDNFTKKYSWINSLIIILLIAAFFWLFF